MSSAINRRGLMLVLSSPSGAGKTTLARGLLETDGNINMSVSVTTVNRAPARPMGRIIILLIRKLLAKCGIAASCLSTPKCSIIITALRRAG